MDFVTDFLLLAATGAACFYCWALSKKLKGLTSSQDGFGAGVAALAKSSEEMKTAMEATKESAEQAANRVEALIAEANEKVEALQQIIGEFDTLSKSIVAQADQTTAAYAETLNPVLEEAQAITTKLTEAIDGARETADVLADRAADMASATRDIARDETVTSENAETTGAGVADLPNDNEASVSSDSDDDDNDDVSDFDLDELTVEQPSVRNTKPARAQKAAGE